MNEHEMYDYDDTLAITNTRRKQLEEEALAHHGIIGMKWGIRRYQNEDGSLTELGQRHYDMLERKQELEYDRRNRKEEADVERQRLKYQRASEKQGLHNQRDRDVYDFANQERERKLHRKNVLTAVAVGALAVGGGIALHNYFKNKGNTPIDAPELTTTISTGKDNVQKLLFNTNGFSNGTANYNFGGSGKNASTFGQTKIDDLKKLMDSSSKAKTLSKGKIKIENLAKKRNWGIADDDKQDVLEKLDSFTSPWDNARKSMANKRAVSISQTIAENQRRNSLNKAIDDTVNRIGSGNVRNSNLIFNKPKSVIPQPSWSTPSWNDPIAKAATSIITKPANSSKSSPVSGASLAQKGADLLAKKAEFDRRSGKVDDAFDRLEKMSKKFKHSGIVDIDTDYMNGIEIMHTAMSIVRRRNTQLEARDEYLSISG